MSKLIIICGLPGTGKTTLAAELSKRTGLFCIHKDTIKESIYKSLGCSGEEDSKKIGKASMELLFNLTEEQRKRGVSFIVEAPFYNEIDYPRINGWSEKYGYKIYSIICTIDNEERIRRKGNRSRDVAHHNNESGSEDAYKNIPGERLSIKTDQAVDVLVDRSVEFLAS